MKRGEVWLTEFGPPSGPEQAGKRPAVIIQSTVLTDTYATVMVIPLTTKLTKASFPTSVLIPAGVGGLPKESVALCHQMQVRGKVRLIERIGELPDLYLEKIEQAVLTAIGM